MRKLTTIILFLWGCAFVQAQGLQSSNLKNDISDVADSSFCVKNYNSQLDSLVNLWYVQKSEGIKYKPEKNKSYDSTYVPHFSDHEYRKRIKEMSSVVNITYNAKVQSYIDVYANKRRNSVSTMLGLSEYYFPIFDDIFEEQGIPQELKYLSIIESALNPKATSPAGARGLWQFMPSTGKMYDLKINSYIDERCDPIKSTYAAAAYLKNLYTIFDDWILAIAAYNCGPGNVRKAIARSGGKTNFWEIYNNLPRETRGYVPAFIAAFYVFEHHELHNLYPRDVKMPVFDTVIVSKKMHVRQIAEYLHVPAKEIVDINPQFRAEIIPYSESGTALYLPIEIVSPFIQLQDSIYAYKDSIYLNIQPEKVIAQESSSASSSGKVKIYYKVKSGDTYSKIARKYGVTVSNLKSWNKRSSNMLHIGEKLVVYVPKSGKGNYAQKSTSTVASTVSSTPKPAKTETASSTVSMPKPVENTSSSSFYTVKKGDSLWSISQRYGTTVEDLKSLNGMTSTYLSQGMNLRIQ